jgi:hypothetical protein
MGERFKQDALEPMEVGEYGFAAKRTAHFALSMGMQSVRRQPLDALSALHG